MLWPAQFLDFLNSSLIWKLCAMAHLVIALGLMLRFRQDDLRANFITSVGQHLCRVCQGAPAAGSGARCIRDVAIAFQDLTMMLERDLARGTIGISAAARARGAAETPVTARARGAAAIP
ncbi:unnamed protein product, partial [Prorocentrum cordatum]